MWVIRDPRKRWVWVQERVRGKGEQGQEKNQKRCRNGWGVMWGKWGKWIIKRKRFWAAFWRGGCSFQSAVLQGIHLHLVPDKFFMPGRFEFEGLDVEVWSLARHLLCSLKWPVLGWFWVRSEGTSMISLRMKRRVSGTQDRDGTAARVRARARVGCFWKTLHFDYTSDALTGKATLNPPSMHTLSFPYLFYSHSSLSTSSCWSEPTRTLSRSQTLGRSSTRLCTLYTQILSKVCGPLSPKDRHG